MISVDNVYRTLLSLSNSDVRGNIKPDEFRLLLNDVVSEIVEGYFSDLNRAVYRENKGYSGGGLENLPDRIGERLRYFLKSETLVYNPLDKAFVLPTDYRYIDAVIHSGSVVVESFSNARDFHILWSSGLDSPSLEYPIYIQTNGFLKVLPLSITSDIDLWYLRRHKPANWTFVVLQGVDIFNPSASDFADIDLHWSEENNVVLRCLSRLGLNLKEQDLTNSSNAKEQQKFTQENTV